MKYSKEDSDKLVEKYNQGLTVCELALEFQVPERSVIAKLSSLGVYKKKQYLNKRGEVPVKKFELIQELSVLCNTNSEIFESLEKCNKHVLELIIQHIRNKSDPKLK